MKFFKQNGISFSMDAGRLRVEGLRSLPDPQAEKIRQQIRENKTAIIMAIQCGARCKNTSLCYGLAYFEAKPGPHRDCTFKDCPWSKKTTNKPGDCPWDFKK